MVFKKRLNKTFKKGVVKMGKFKKEVINKIKDMDKKYYINQVELLLDNNYGQECQQVFECYQNEKLTKRGVQHFRRYLYKASMDFLMWYTDYIVSEKTLIKYLKEDNYIVELSNDLIKGIECNVEDNENYLLSLNKDVI